MSTEPGLFTEPARVPAPNQRPKRHAPNSVKPSTGSSTEGRRTRTLAGSHTAPSEPINDMSLIEAVIATALEVGYVLGAEPGQVWRRRSAKSGAVDPVPADEAIGVRQLFREGLLTRGGAQQVTRGLSKVLAVAVVVPKRTRLIAHRWASLRKPAAWLVESRGDERGGVPS